MTGGLLQLVARGTQDIFLTSKPQVTFFKTIYRRHTNFSIEQIRQNFKQTLDFGKKATCVISKSGDMVSKIYLVLTLPKINQFILETDTEDTITKFAWIRKIGFGIIKSIEVSIGGQLIDKHYGEWLNIFTELSGNQDSALDKMIGNISEATTFTNGKEKIQLFIPLQFWFCRTFGSALPMVSLTYSDVSINVELNSAEDCYFVSPTNYIELNDEIVQFTEGEYIEQTMDGSTASGMFVKYDPITKRMYYIQISKKKFVSMELAEPSFDHIFEALSGYNDKYLIVGQTTGYKAMPMFNTSPVTHTHSTTPLQNLSIEQPFLLVSYIFLDSEEREKFAKGKHEYLIESVINGTDTTLKSNQTVRLDLVHPCKYIVWTVQQNYLRTNKDYFNYTDSYRYNDAGEQIGNELIETETIILNDQDVIEERTARYFSCYQPYKYFQLNKKGINVYSFSLHPTVNQPSGTCNMSVIENVGVRMALNHIIKLDNTAIFKSYAVIYQILRIANGFCSPIFSSSGG